MHSFFLLELLVVKVSSSLSWLLQINHGFGIVSPAKGAYSSFLLAISALCFIPTRSIIFTLLASFFFS
jgi:hypothetical protein